MKRSNDSLAGKVVLLTAISLPVNEALELCLYEASGTRWRRIIITDTSGSKLDVDSEYSIRTTVVEDHLGVSRPLMTWALSNAVGAVDMDAELLQAVLRQALEA